MIDGLKVTMPGEELRRQLEAQIQHHEQRAAHWAREQSRTSEDEIEEAPLLPEHVCRNETERHVWRREVLTFIRDHVEAAETYRLSLTDLEAGELLPRAPEWLIRDEYEERTRIGFALERIGKTAECGGTHPGLLASRHTHTDVAPEPTDRSEETELPDLISITGRKSS